MEAERRWFLVLTVLQQSHVMQETRMHNCNFFVTSALTSKTRGIRFFLLFYLIFNIRRCRVMADMKDQVVMASQMEVRRKEKG